MELHICRESFTGELPSGAWKTYYAGKDVLDPAQPDEAALLELWGAYFKPIRSTHGQSADDLNRLGVED